MKMSMALEAVLLAVTATLPLSQARAQVDFPVERPTLKIGEFWKYKTIDLWNNRELSTSEIEFVQTDDQRLVFRSRSSLRENVSTDYYTLDLQPCRSLRNSDKIVCAGALQFPLQIGNRHRFEKLPWANGNGHFTETCEVKGAEKITVPAGSFDTVRVECEGLWTRVFDGAFSGRVIENIWYSPAIKRTAKAQYTDYQSSGGMFNRTETQLVEFFNK